MNFVFLITSQITHIWQYADKRATKYGTFSCIHMAVHILNNQQYKDISCRLFPTVRKERLTLMVRNQNLSCFFSIFLLNLCYPLCLEPLWHTLSTSHKPPLTHAALLVCRSVQSMIPAHTCSRRRPGEFQQHKWTCKQRMLRTRTHQHWNACLTHAAAAFTHRHTDRCSALVLAIYVWTLAFPAIICITVTITTN